MRILTNLYPQGHGKNNLRNNTLLTSSLKKEHKKDKGHILDSAECIGVACSSTAAIPVKSTVKTDDAKLVLVDTSLKATDIQHYGQVDRKNDSKTSSFYSDDKSKKTASPSSDDKSKKTASSPSSDSKSKEIASPSTDSKSKKTASTSSSDP